MVAGRAKTGPAAALATGAFALALSLAIGRILPSRAVPGTRAGKPGPGHAGSRGGDSSDPRPGVRASEPSRGGGAKAPTDIPPAGWRDIAWRLHGQVDEDRILAVAAGVTFYGLLAIFPALGAFVALYGLVADPATIGDHLAVLGGILPNSALDIVGEQVRRLTSKPGGTLGLAFFSGLAVSLWSANAGMKAIFDALNVAYDETEKRGFVALNLWSLGFTLAAILFLGTVMGSVVVIPIVLRFVGLGEATDWLVWIGRWPAMACVTLLAFAILYRFGPSRDRPQWRWVSPGSILAAAGWLGFSMLFSWYVGSFGTYNETYGSLGAAIGFMTWMWLSATIILVGAELNSEIEHQAARDANDARPGPRGAPMGGTLGEARA